MKERDSTRKKISKAYYSEKAVLQQKYKKLRNKVSCQIRKENVDFNKNRINEASNEAEL